MTSAPVHKPANCLTSSGDQLAIHFKIGQLFISRRSSSVRITREIQVITFQNRHFSKKKMLCVKLWVVLLAVYAACVAQDQVCVSKHNLCHQTRIVDTEVTCVSFTGERLMLACAGREREKVKKKVLMTGSSPIYNRVLLYVQLVKCTQSTVECIGSVRSRDVAIKCKCRRKSKTLPTPPTTTTNKPTKDPFDLEFDLPHTLPSTTTSTTPPPSLVKTAGPEWKIPVIVIGVLLVLVLAVAVFVCADKRERRRRRHILIGNTTTTSNISNDSSDDGSRTADNLRHSPGNVTHFLFFHLVLVILVFFHFYWCQIPLLVNRVCNWSACPPPTVLFLLFSEKV